jgi:hypothetical protein
VTSPVRRESAVVSDILKYLRAHGAFAEKLHGDSLQTAVLDIMACYRGRFILLEVKRSANLDATPRQKYTIAQVKLAGGISLKVSSVGEVASILEAIDAELDSRGGGYGATI